MASEQEIQAIIKRSQDILKKKASVYAEQRKADELEKAKKDWAWQGWSGPQEHHTCEVKQINALSGEISPEKWQWSSYCLWERVFLHRQLQDGRWLGSLAMGMGYWWGREKLIRWPKDGEVVILEVRNIQAPQHDANVLRQRDQYYEPIPAGDVFYGDYLLVDGEQVYVSDIVDCGGSEVVLTYETHDETKTLPVKRTDEIPVRMMCLPHKWADKKTWQTIDTELLMSSKAVVVYS